MDLNRFSRREMLKSTPIATVSGTLAAGLVAKLGSTVQAQENVPDNPLESDRKIRIGVVGGGFGRSFQWHEHPNCTVTAVTDLYPERRKRLRDLYGCDNVYDTFEELIEKETGCSNRRALERALGDHVGEHGSLMCAAIDQLPELVRATADLTLRKAARRHVATLFTKSLRADDVPACVEREEFALFLPDTGLTDALGVAKRLGSTVSESVLDFGKQRKLSCSFGVASIPETVPSTGGLLAAARSALGKAKAGGPGCVVPANEP